MDLKFLNFQVCHMLEYEARRCYHQKCLSNIYHPEIWTSKPNLERERKIKEIANTTRSNQIDELFHCAQSVQSTEEHSYRNCSQQFFRGLLQNYQHKVKS